MFFNVSNHPSSKWSAEQIEAAKALCGEIRDIAFPNVSPTATTADVSALADRLAAEIPDGSVVMAQGEFSLTYALTRRLRDRGVTVAVACSDRRVVETVKTDGMVEKTAIFTFAGFRVVE